MRFVKIEGAGNDYVLVDVFEEPVHGAPQLARRMSDRHTGIGSDGLILVGRAEGDAHAAMRIFNADGSEGRMCGNGLRCVVRYLVETARATGPDVRVETASGPRLGRLLGPDRVELDMGVPSFAPADVPVDLPGDGQAPPELPLPRTLRADPDVGLCASIGNPHVVVRVPDPARVDLEQHGPPLEKAPAFPEGANVHFIRVEADDRITAHTWERGSGATRACGTGAVAIAAVAVRLGWAPPGRVRIDMPGGALHVRWNGEDAAWLEGPARIPFRGEWSAS
ncbi:MAG: diaminopimelate epimerase [Planctomycetota bacterium]